MNTFDFKELSWLLMLIPLGIVFCAGLLFLSSTSRWVRQKRMVSALAEPDFNLVHANFNSRQFFFAQPPVWLAIKANDPAIVQAALGLHHPTPCWWEDGLVEARQDKLFISPPISGWILVVGSGLPEPGDNIDRCYHFLVRLSRQLKQVQYFCADRILNHHAWAILDAGEVFRAYAWAGQTLWNQGLITAAEKELKILCLDYATQQNF
ncbi:MAG: hypothetical protein ACR2H1_07320, partial [Limisphaerales bacterium]